MSKELTEQWRNGKLPQGYYYFKTSEGVVIGYIRTALKYPYGGYRCAIDDVREALSEVPDYTEWKQTEEQVQNLQRMVEQECSKRCELEEQLKEANDVLKQIADTRNFQYGHKFAQSYIKKWGVK